MVTSSFLSVSIPLVVNFMLIVLPVESNLFHRLTSYPEPHHAYAAPYQPPPYGDPYPRPQQQYRSPFIHSFASAVPGASSNSISRGGPLDAIGPSYQQPPPQQPQQPQQPQPPQQPQQPQPPQQPSTYYTGVQQPPNTDPFIVQPQPQPINPFEGQQPPSINPYGGQQQQQQQSQQSLHQFTGPQQLPQQQLPPQQFPQQLPSQQLPQQLPTQQFPQQQFPQQQFPQQQFPPQQIPSNPNPMPMSQGTGGGGGATAEPGEGPVAAPGGEMGSQLPTNLLLNNIRNPQPQRHNRINSRPGGSVPMTKAIKQMVNRWATQMGHKSYYEAHGCVDPTTVLHGTPSRTASFAMMLGCQTREAQESCQLAQLSQGGGQMARTRMMMQVMLPKQTVKMFEHCLSPTTFMSGMTGMLTSSMTSNNQAIAPPPGAAAFNQHSSVKPDCSLVSQMLMMSPSAAEGGMFSPEAMENIGLMRNKYMTMTCQENLILGSLPFRMCCPGKVRPPTMQEAIMMRGMGAGGA